jgi:hypothetical protein
MKDTPWCVVDFDAAIPPSIVAARFYQPIPNKCIEM